MRKIAVAVLAVPVLTVVYAATLRHRPRALRATLGFAGAAFALLLVVAFMPRATSAVPTTRATAVAATQFGPDVASIDGLAGAVEVSFAQPMDPTSVEAAVSLSPAMPVRMTWADPGRRLLVAPARAWTPATYYTLTVSNAARTTAGTAMNAPVIKGFYTRPSATASVRSTSTRSDGRVNLKGTFVVDFDRPIQADSARAAFAISPKVAGALNVSIRTDGGTRLTFVPRAALAPNTTYTITLAGTVYDADGAPVAEVPALTVRSAAAPKATPRPAKTSKPSSGSASKPTKPVSTPVTKPGSKPVGILHVVRFRPFDGSTKVGPAADISVRFTKAMERQSTEHAFQVLASGRRVTGTFTWFEGNRVLLFNPTRSLPAGARVSMRVTTAARAADGSRLAKAMSGIFTVVPKSKPIKPPRPPSGGGGSGAGAWASVERYYLGLMNCTRGGGMVTSSGSCSSPGGSGIAPLWIDAGISAKVARPYAKLLATTGVCSHFYGGNPGSRLHRAGYTSYRWAENLGCRSASSPFASVLGTHIYFQSERSWRPQGGHWVNLMNAGYDRVGLGVWVSHGRVRLVIDFYHP